MCVCRTWRHLNSHLTDRFERLAADEADRITDGRPFPPQPPLGERFNVQEITLMARYHEQRAVWRAGPPSKWPRHQTSAGSIAVDRNSVA
jgi:hypothetical protein